MQPVTVESIESYRTSHNPPTATANKKNLHCCHSTQPLCCPTAPRVTANENPKYLSPAEVKEIMRRMWELNEPLLQYIYPTDVARRQRRRGGSAHSAAAAGNATAKVGGGLGAGR